MTYKCATPMVLHKASLARTKMNFLKPGVSVLLSFIDRLRFKGLVN